MEPQTNPQGAAPKRLRALAILILVGTLLRAVPILWGTTYWNPVQYNFHPDEPKIVRQVDDFPTYLTEYHDYRYPHFLHMTYGIAWWAIGDALDLRDETVSQPGVPGYERTLIFTRILNTLIFGAGAMLLLWYFGRRMFGPGSALFVVAASSVQGWVVASTSLVQTDVPSAYALLALFYVLLGIDRSDGLRPRQGWLVGALMGIAIAMKYTAAVGWLAIGISAVAAIRRKALSPGQALGFLGLAALGCLLAFVLFVPGSVYDFASFKLSLEWEFQSKMKLADFRWELFFRDLFTCLPLWILIPAALGWVLSLSKVRAVTSWSIVACLGISVATSARAFRPDYAVSLMPFAAAYSGYALWRLACWIPIGRKAAVLYLIAGHLFVGYVVYQRYAGETRYTAEAWIQANIEPGPLGDGPIAREGRTAAPEPPVGYEFVPVYDQPEWIVLCERHYEPFKNTTADPAFYSYLGYSVADPNNRELGLFKERDYRFYEDVLLGMRREHKYDLIQEFLSPQLPLDMKGGDVKIYRKTPAE